MAENPRIEELRRRVQADPASIAFAALAEEYRRAGRYTEAIETCRTGLQRHPSYLSARVTLGRSLVEVGEFDAARAELEYVLRAAPENLAAIRALAEIHEKRGDTPEALEHYKAALEVARQDAHQQPAPVPASDASALEGWTLPKAAAPGARVALEPLPPPPERLALEPLPTPPERLAPVPVPKLVEPLPKPEPLPPPQPADYANKAVLQGLERFLASIQAVRRSASAEQRTVSIR